MGLEAVASFVYGEKGGGGAGGAAALDWYQERDRVAFAAVTASQVGHTARLVAAAARREPVYVLCRLAEEAAAQEEAPGEHTLVWAAGRTSH